MADPLESLETILGAKSNLKIIKSMLDVDNAPRSINSISEKSGIAYSVAHRDIHTLKEAGFIIEEDTKYKINTSHPMYLRISRLFQEDLPAGLAISNRQKKDISKMVAEIENHDSANIIVHHNADPDAIGSAVSLALALQRIGKKATISAPLGISLQSRQILEKYPFPVRDDLEKNPSLIIIIDSSSGEQVGALEFRTSPKIMLIDHHERGTIEELADLAYVDTEAHSTAILVYRLIVTSKIPIIRDAAPYLLSGIIADTAFLRLANRDDIAAVNDLLSYINLEDIFETLSSKEDISERIAKLKVLMRAEMYRVRNLIIAFSRVGSFESRAAVHLVKAGVDIAFVFNIQKDEIRLSARVRKYLKDIDLVSILKNIEPFIDGSAGGHREAASANGRNTKNIHKIKQVLLDVFEKREDSKAQRIS